MIDIHSHILPGIDDGAADMEEALNMAKTAVREGITTVIATPHHQNGMYINEASNIQQLVQQLNERLQAEEIPLAILRGQEARVHSRFIDDLYEGSIQTLNDTRYVLIEFPFARIPPNIADVMHECRINGLIPVIAHPERNKEIIQHRDKLQELIRMGALSQVTSHSITGAFGDKVQAVSYDLCRRGLVHFIASDAHNAANRTFALRQAYASIERELGEQAADYYKNNANLLIYNREIPKIAPIQKPKKWYQLWTRSV